MIAAQAAGLAADGYRIFPAKPGGKWALHTGWQAEATTDVERVAALWAGRSPEPNIGICTGGDLLVIDLDEKQGKHGIAAWNALKAVHGGDPLVTRTVRTPSGGLHEYFTKPADIFISGKANHLGDGIDVRADGNLVLGPGSVIDGKAYELVVPGPVLPAPAWLLELLTAESHNGDAPKFESADAPITEPGRNQYLIRYAGRQRAIGHTVEEVRALVLAENERTVRPPVDIAELERTVFKSAARWEQGEAPGVLRHSGHAAAEPEPLPEFPTALLPSVVRQLVEAESERLRLPTAMMATAALVTAAGAIGAGRSVYTDDRAHSAALWGVVVAGTGSGKSPALDVALKPLRVAAARREAERAEAFDRLDKWAKLPAADREATTQPAVPPMLRLTDTTTEGLAEALKFTPRGLLVDVDELTTWARGMDAYRSHGVGPDRARYCALWGSQSMAIVRKGQRPIVVPHPVVSIVGGIQPAALTALNSAPDGLAQRFLFAHYPDDVEVVRSHAAPDVAALRAWDAVVTRLLGLAEADYYVDGRLRAEQLGMTEPALRCWQAHCDQRIAEQRLYDARPLYAKFDAIAARLALVLTLLDDPDATIVGVPAVEAAWQLLFQFYGPHGRAALSAHAVTEHSPAGALERYLRRQDGRAATLRMILRSGVAGCQDADDVQALVNQLVARGQAHTEERPRPGGGTPSLWVALT